MQEQLKFELKIYCYREKIVILFSYNKEIKIDDAHQKCKFRNHLQVQLPFDSFLLSDIM